MRYNVKEKKYKTVSYLLLGIILISTISTVQFSFKVTGNEDGGGFEPQSSTNNLIYGNVFVDNSIANAYDASSTNSFDNGYPTGGNYWDDYYGSDNYQGENQDVLGSDGIGDTPYTSGNVYDQYPLYWGGDEPYDPDGEDGGGQEGLSPTVITNHTDYLEETTATIHGYLYSDGGFTTTVNFQYGLTTSYGTNTVSQTKETFDTFFQGLTGLSPGTLYHYRTKAVNEWGTSYGSDSTFLTKPYEPSSLIANVYEDSNISLGWSSGVGADRTIVERNTISSWSRGNGSVVYNNTGTSTYDTGALINGETYYYQAWSYASDSGLFQFSDLNSSNNVTISIPLDVLTNSSKGIEEVNATLQGYLNDSNSTNVFVRFEWGETSVYGNTTLNQTKSEGDEFTNDTIGAETSTTYFFTAYDINNAWNTNPENMVDGTILDYATTDTIGDSEMLIANNCTGEYLGNINNVSIRLYGGTDAAEVEDVDLNFVPYFNGVSGNTYNWDKPGSLKWSSWYEITTDPSAPVNWSWKDVSKLDVNVSRAGTWASDNLWCGQVEIRVNYTQGLLSPGTYYHYRAITNQSSILDYGDDITFLTKPIQPLVLGSSRWSNKVNLSWNKGQGANRTYIERNTTPDWPFGDAISVYNNTGTQYQDTVPGGGDYYYQAWSYSDWGTLYQYSDDYTLNTTVEIPTIYTDNPTNVEETTATLNATLVDDGGEPCTVWFEYGEGPTFGNTTSTQILSAGAVSIDISGLKQGTFYYFRAVANNTAGNTSDYGSTRNFITKPTSPTDLDIITLDATTFRLTWSKGTGAYKTYIERNTSSGWPIFNGTNIYNNTAETYDDTVADTDVLYYFQAWSYAEKLSLPWFRQYSDNYDIINNIVSPNSTVNTTSNLEETTVALHGYLVNDGGSGEDCEAKFQYDTTEAYANETSPQIVTTGEEFTNSNVTGLLKGRRYYYRSVANNTYGTRNSSGKQFLTKPDEISGFTITPHNSTSINLSWTNNDGGDGVYIEYVGALNDQPARTNITYYFNQFDAGRYEWETNPVYMVDNNLSNYSSTNTDSKIERLIWNTCSGGKIGTINRVEIRARGLTNTNDNCILRPLFNGTDEGNQHTITTFTSDASWSQWFDITNDTNAPSTWSYTYVKNLDCDVIADITGGGDIYVSKVEIRVNYTWQPGDFINFTTGGYVIDNNVTHSGLSRGYIYYYKAWSVAQDGGLTSNGTSNAPYGNPVTQNYTLTGPGEVKYNGTTNIEETSSTLHGFLKRDGGLDCKVWFEWGETLSYGNKTTNETEKRLNYVFTADLTGLDNGTFYYVRAAANNSADTVYSDKSGFITKPLEPTGLNAEVYKNNYTKNQINLTWTKGDGANKTVIRYNINTGYPTSPTDGRLAYNGTNSYFNHTNLSQNVTYYYKAWSYSEYSYTDTIEITVFQFSDANISAENNTEDYIHFITIDGRGNASYIDSGNPTFIWNKYTDTKMYWLQISNDVDFEDVVVNIVNVSKYEFPLYYSEDAANVTFILPPAYTLDYGNVYYTRVRPYIKGYYAGVWW